ncbi:hypothetical protein [Streptomyces sp. NPDC002889]|uniref:hypothetical protein n=1 Tax=Streptomyces sp. NPDC002889 TaxID=3364669 RepID=UPI00369FD057
MGRTGTTRRRALVVTGAVAAGLLTGCSNDASGDRRTAGSAPDPVHAAARLRRALADTSRALLDEYDAVIAQHPALTGRLMPLRAAVAEHVTALAPGSGASPSPSASLSPAPPPSSPPTAKAVVAPDPGAALKALAAAERRTSASHAASLADAEPELARLLASVAAAGAAHAYLLTKGDAR